MNYRFMALATLFVVLLLSAVPTALAQGAKPQSDLSPTQRLEVMRSKLESLRRSLNNAVSTLPQKSTDKKQPVDDPRIRLQGLEKEVSSILSEVNDIRGKQDRSERYDATVIDRLETSVVDIDTRAQAGLQATAGARTASSPSGAPAKKKKKGKFFGLFGGGDDDKYAELTGEVAAGRDRVLFEEAAKQVRKGSHETGRLLFQTIINTYPDSGFLPLAKLAIADSFYLEGTTSNLIQAAQAYQDWLTFFPTDPLAPYAMMKVAESEMRQMGLPDRDPTHAIKAELRLKILLQQYPQTKLRPDVEHRLREVQENLALHNLWIGNFYYKAKYEQGKGGLKGAQRRYREIVDKYPNFSFMDEVLYRLAATYQQEEEPDEAGKYYQQLLRNHPNSEWAEKSREQLGIIGLPVPDPDPARKNAPPPVRPGILESVLQQVSGRADVTVDKNGVLISKDGKEGNDLIDEGLKYNGQLPTNVTPQAPVQRNTSKPAPANPAPRSGVQNVAPVNTTSPASAPVKP